MSGAGGTPDEFRGASEREYLIRCNAHLLGLLKDLSVRSERLTRYEAAQILRTYPTHQMSKTRAKAWTEVIDTLCPPSWPAERAATDRATLDSELARLDKDAQQG